MLAGIKRTQAKGGDKVGVWEFNLGEVEEQISIHKQELGRFEKLESYYKGENTTIANKRTEPGKPANKSAHAFGNYISNIFSAYFMGKPVSYSSNDQEYLEELQRVFNRNDEMDENYQIALLQSIFGTAYEVIYTNEEGEIEFEELSPLYCFIKYDESIKPKKLYGVKYGQNLATVYTATEIIEFVNENDKLKEVSREPHYFEEVPIIEYINNRYKLGDFETVLSLIDAYDLLVSNKLNDLDYFSNAYLKLTGLFPDTEELSRMRDNRVIMLAENGEAEFLTKPEADKGAETVRLHILKDIHRFSTIPDFLAESYAQRSGLALSWQNLSLDQTLAVKQRSFHRALQDRIKLITRILNLKLKKDWQFDEISIVFGANKPVSAREQAEIIVMLNGLVSKQTLLSNLEIVEDVNMELKRIEQEELNSIYPEEVPQQKDLASQTISNRKRIRSDVARYSPDDRRD